MKRYKAIVAYDGGEFYGWQYLGEKPTVQEELQRCLEKILQHPVSLEAASRTDAGVHAFGQVVAFNGEKEVTLKSINSLTSDALVVRDIQEVPLNFHPTLDSTGKHYRYTLFLGEVHFPLSQKFTWHIKKSLNFEAIKECAIHFLGKRNFKALCNIRKDLKYLSYERTVHAIDFEWESEHLLHIHVKGDAFLYKMVRNLVGTLVDVGRGKLLAKDISKLLEKEDRRELGVTAPACGLSLWEVYYP